MNFYIYSLSEAIAVAASVWPAGLLDAPVETVEHAGLSLIVSRIERLPTPVRWVDLQAHDAVNRAVLDGGVCVPLRYGTMSATRQQCVELIEQRIDYWRETIERVRGHVEISIKGLLPAQPEAAAAQHVPVAAGPGTAYLQRRRADLEAQERLVERSKHLAEEIRHELGLPSDAVIVDSRGRLIDVALLIRREFSSEVVARLRTRIETLPGRWRVGAPWPPYSFVGAPTGSGHLGPAKEERKRGEPG